MPTIRIERVGQPDLEFEGELLYKVSSRKDEFQTRWTELSLYKSATGKYIYTNSGMTIIPGEKNRGGCAIFNYPKDLLIETMQTADDGSFYVSNLAKSLLHGLAEKFEEFRGIEVERV